MQELKRLLKQYAEDTDRVLTKLMKLEGAISETLSQAMAYTLFSGGKRLRPILTRLVAEMLEGEIKQAMEVGAAIELIHTYSLVHDDLPSMDNDDFRRGKPTNHKVYGTGIAILAGDGLLTYAFNILARVDLPAEKVIKIIDLISQGAGYQGMVGGQVLDLEAENQEITLEELKKIHQAKTGALFKASILAGAYCAEPNAEEIKALENYATYLGITFQIVDDLLDLIGDEKKLGKKTGSDHKLNKATYPSLLGLEKSKEEALRNARLAQDALKRFGQRGKLLHDLVDYVLIRQS